MLENSYDNKEETIKNGAPWSNFASRKNFEDADKLRNEKLQEEGLQVKIKYLPSMKRFVVKVRQDPAFLLSEKLVKKSKKNKKSKR